ncbi:Mor transcription activator family protein [Paenibacillus melissococcoides]|uniref:Mor transcription activator family protein n=1 Tax=Paenibacillus melissococcoides TaxID=2912268 RepID=UPI0036F34F97
MCTSPPLDFFFRRVRDRRIIQEYDGYNHREIAQKYELSERRGREICDGNPSSFSTEG